jgi:hypothetical protein
MVKASSDLLTGCRYIPKSNNIIKERKEERKDSVGINM